MKCMKISVQQIKMSLQFSNIEVFCLFFVTLQRLKEKIEAK